tara:strand:+ start:391 stop:594 length:204 start_codon:yes stop_codon:yes gene_type:complete
MGEAKRRKELGVSARPKEIELPKFNKEEVKKKVRSFLYKNPIIPFIFYGFGIATIIVGTIGILKFYR